MKTAVTEQLGIEVPLFCGAMYPCSNPELVAAVSQSVAGIEAVEPAGEIVRRFARAAEEASQIRGPW